jgi:hypothetical protein
VTPIRPTVEERLRRCESILALVADLGMLAAMRSEVSLSAEGLHALAQLAREAAEELDATRRVLPATVLNLTAPAVTELRRDREGLGMSPWQVASVLCVGVEPIGGQHNEAINQSCERSRSHSTKAEPP